MLTKTELTQVKKGTGVPIATVREYLEMDFEDCDEEVTVDELIAHINYQEKLGMISRSCDSEAEFSAMWCEMF